MYSIVDWWCTFSVSTLNVKNVMYTNLTIHFNKVQCTHKSLCHPCDWWSFFNCCFILSHCLSPFAHVILHVNHYDNGLMHRWYIIVSWWYTFWVSTSTRLDWFWYLGFGIWVLIYFSYWASINIAYFLRLSY
jgi:hypothetical protein